MDRCGGATALIDRYDDVRNVATPSMVDGSGTWLCPTVLDRVRFVDMGRRHRWVYSLVGVTMLVVLAVGTRWTGPAPLAVMVVAMVLGGTAELISARSPRPEIGVAVSLAVLQAGVVVAILLTGGVTSPVLPWSALLLPSLAARFPARVVLAGAVLDVVALTAAVLVQDGHAVADDPSPLLYALGVVVVVSAVGITMGVSDRIHRGEAAIDPLTGLLNRASLPERMQELVAQARLTGGGLALVLADIDHFKDVNDTHGHDRGDTVLREVADEVRRSFRQFELIYRIGGEELLVVLPGAGRAEATAAAERIRERVEAAHPGGLLVTLSCGVAAAAGDGLDFAALFGAADRALYEAKDGGRNRVVASPAFTSPMSPRVVPERRRSA